MSFDYLAKAPFNLDAEAIAWVKTQLVGLSPDDKLRQLFNLRLAGTNPDDIAAAKAFRPGGITRHVGRRSRRRAPADRRAQRQRQPCRC